MNYYIVFDDEDKSDVLEVIGQATRDEALAVFNAYYGSTDAVLFEYDVDGEEIINGRLVSA